MSGESLFTTIKNTIEGIKIKIPHIKITLSEITPRMDDHDIEVKATNTLLNQYFQADATVYIARHNNLRDPDFFYDAKHLKQSIIPRFAANIKRALNRAHDMKYGDKNRILSTMV